MTVSPGSFSHLETIEVHSHDAIGIVCRCTKVKVNLLIALQSKTLFKRKTVNFDANDIPTMQLLSCQTKFKSVI